jgi:hypothetical protein
MSFSKTYYLRLEGQNIDLFSVVPKESCTDAITLDFETVADQENWELEVCSGKWLYVDDQLTQNPDWVDTSLSELPSSSIVQP